MLFILFPRSIIGRSNASEIPDGYIPIYSPEDLWNVRYNMSSNYILMCDLDLTEAMSAGGLFYGAWTALGVQSGVSTTPFQGVFDGNGHCITGWNGGQFIAVNDGTIKNLTISGSNNGYGICRRNNNTIRNCHKYGYIYCNSEYGISVGGICEVNYGTIELCSVHGSVNGNGGHFNTSAQVDVGGIVGDNEGTICYSYNAASVSGYSESASAGPSVGGICGRNNKGSIMDCYNCGDVLSCNSWSTTSSTNDSTLYAYAGGLAGRNGTASIVRCYNAGIAKAKYTFSNPYKTKIYAGALTGSASASRFTDCYYKNNMDKPCGEENNTGKSTRLTDGLMQMSTSFPSFDFTWI